MARTPDEVVTDFCKLWYHHPDLDAIVECFTEDAVYLNIPLPQVEGREAIRESIAGFVGAFDHIEFTVHLQVSNGDLVMNERTDVMIKKGGGELALPVVGVFEVRDGRIAAWRDYFDLATVTAAFG